MFRDERQRQRVCHALVATLPRGFDLWTAAGPTELALHYEATNGGALSGSERRLLLTAFALWNGSGDLPVAELLDLDAKLLAHVAALLVALAAGPPWTAVDAWEEPRRPVPVRLA